MAPFQLRVRTLYPRTQPVPFTPLSIRLGPPPTSDVHAGEVRTQHVDRAAHGPDGALGETGRPGPVGRWPPVAIDADQLHAGRLAVSGRGKGGQEPADRGAARGFKPPDGRRELQVGPPQVARGQPAPRRMLRVRGDRRGAGPLLARQGDLVGPPSSFMNFRRRLLRLRACQWWRQ